MSGTLEHGFRCPSESYVIDRPIHLARLASGFAPCRACEHRDDTGLRAQSSPAPETAAASTDAAGSQTGWFDVDSDELEGPCGVAHNQIDAMRVRQFSAALGTAIREAAEPGSRVPRVAVAADGRWLTAELAAAAGEGLLASGCRVVDTGAATVGSLAFLVRRHQLDGGLLLGNASGAPQRVSLKCWGPPGSPWSIGGGLDRVKRVLAAGSGRGSRRSGGLERVDVAAEYREAFVDLFHGLRPLGFVLDTTCAPLVAHLRHLTAHSACRIASPRLPPVGQTALAGGSKTIRTSASAKPTGSAWLAQRARRVERLARQVADEAAGFGLWIDGDGDTLALVDERRRTVNPERLLVALARRLASGAKSVGVVLEMEASAAARGQLRAAGARVIDSPSTRESMFAVLAQSGALLGGGPSGRFWFASESVAADALWAVGVLLQLLSAGDAPLSEVLP